MALTSVTAGVRVRTAKDWRTAKYGTVRRVCRTAGWVEVQIDGEPVSCSFMVTELLDADAPYPEHYHRCEWCGKLESCNQCCGSGQPYDPYGPEDFDSEGVLPGGHCDADCYNHKRPQGCMQNTTADGRRVEPAPF